MKQRISVGLQHTNIKMQGKPAVRNSTLEKHRHALRPCAAIHAIKPSTVVYGYMLNNSYSLMNNNNSLKKNNVIKTR